MDTNRFRSNHPAAVPSAITPVIDLIGMTNYRHLDLFSAIPSLKDVLDEIGSLPRDALFLGQAEDGLPVLLNLYDPLPGPVLVIGTQGAGKTQLLQVVSQFVISTHSPREIQFGVITKCIEEWPDKIADSSNCVGIFSTRGPDARRFVHSLAIWTNGSISNDQSVLMLIDDFEEILHWDSTTLACLQRILLHGPKARVWPLVTLDPGNSGQLHEWLKLFRMRIYQHGIAFNEIGAFPEYPRVEGEGMLGDTRFIIKEGSQWIKFWIPALM